MNAELPTLERASALDPKFYTDPAIYARELREVIAPGWQVIAPASAVAEAGTVLTREVGGVPVIVLRDDAGVLRGFTNICPHRAGPLATCDQKGASRLRCAYHGWTYDLAGQLKLAPQMQDAQGFDKSDIRLTPIDVKIWHNLVYARIATTAHPGDPFEAVYAGIEAIVADTGLDQMEHRHGLTYDVAANWKVYVDNFLEGYHLPFVHPGLTQAVDYSEYVTELGDFWSLQRAPVEENGAYGAGEGLYFFVCPNVMLNIMPGRLQTNRVVPTGLASCKVEFDFYYAPDAAHRVEEDVAFTDQVQEEDRLICEHVQKGLASGSYVGGRLCPSKEGGVWHFQNLMRKFYTQDGDCV